ncbi:MAG: hypothetical protein R3F59_18015 [Myxococcota bacterium]
MGRGALGELVVLVALAGCGGGAEEAGPCGEGPVADPFEAAGGSLDFAVGPVVAAFFGTFAGELHTDAGDAPLSLVVDAPAGAEVVVGPSGSCDDAAYQVGLRLLLVAPDAVRALTDVDVLLAEPVTQLVLNDQVQYDQAGVDLIDPAMGSDPVLVLFTSRFDGAGWSGEIGWRFVDGEGFDPEGQLATWTASR